MENLFSASMLVRIFYIARNRNFIDLEESSFDIGLNIERERVWIPIIYF